MFCGDILLFKGTINILQNYYITKAYVKPIQAEHYIIKSEYQWIINSRMLVEEVKEDHQQLLVIYNLVPFTDLLKYVGSIAQVGKIIYFFEFILVLKHKVLNNI